MREFVIELKNVSKSFNREIVLNNVNLQVKQGEFLTLLGPSGCGKTTILRLLAGFETPTAGALYLDGQDVCNLPPEHRHVNTVFQSYALFPHMTVFDNVAFGLRIKRLPEIDVKKQVVACLDMVKLAEFANRKPNQLSGGQQQRVAIARAVVNKPLVLLLDEPLSALDYKLRKTMQIELKQLQRQLGITFIFVTHDQEEALSMSDRVAVMNLGRIEQLGTPREIYENPKNLFVAQFVGESNILSGKILENQGDMFKVEINHQIISLKNPHHLPLQERINILLRPEDLQIWNAQTLDETHKREALPAQVEEVIYKGTTVNLLVRLENGQQLAATEFFNADNPKLDYQIGEQVLVNWVKGWEILLPHEV